MAVKLVGILGQSIEEIHLGGNVHQGVASALDQRRHQLQVHLGGVDGRLQVGFGQSIKVLCAHLPQIVAVEVFQLLLIEDGGGFGHAGHLEDLGQVLQCEKLPLGIFALGCPAQQCHIVEDGRGDIALGLQVLVGGVPVALGHLIVGVPHDGGAVDILGHRPAKGVVKPGVLGGGGEVLRPSDHMGDAHEMVVNDIGKVVGGQSVPLHQYLVVQSVVVHGDVPEDHVLEGGLPLPGDLLADHIGLSGLYPGLGLFKGKAAAGVFRLLEVAAVLGGFGLVAEAIVGLALLHQQMGILCVKVPPLGLDIGTHRAADIGTLVPGKAALLQGVVNDLGGALYQTALVGVLNAQDKPAPGVPGDQPGIKGGAQVADVHISRGGRGKTGADLPGRNALFHIVKPGHIHDSFLLKIVL